MSTAPVQDPISELLGSFAPDPLCPKHMVFGPCGGVHDDGRCEMVVAPCPFATRAVAGWPLPPLPPRAPEPGSLLALAAERPVVLTDFTVDPYDRDSIRDVANTLAGSADALLIGEHHNRPDFPPTLLGSLVMAAGGRPWVTLTCRDRNRLVLEQELAGLHAVGIDEVLCVTGDGRAPGVRPGVTQVYDLDSTRLAYLAASHGLTAAVAESPQAVPMAARPARVLLKQQAGASLCILNHVGTPSDVADFVSAAKRVGVTLPFVASVAVFTDVRSAEVLRRFPGLHLSDDGIAAVLSADSPRAAGIDAAVTEARALLAIPGVVGVNLSGLASADGTVAAAAVKASVGREVLGR